MTSSSSPTDEYRIERVDQGVTIELGPAGSPVALMTDDAATDLAWAIIDTLGEERDV